MKKLIVLLISSMVAINAYAYHVLCQSKGRPVPSNAAYSYMQNKNTRCSTILTRPEKSGVITTLKQYDPDTKIVRTTEGKVCTPDTLNKNFYVRNVVMHLKNKKTIKDVLEVLEGKQQ